MSKVYKITAADQKIADRLKRYLSELNLLTDFNEIRVESQTCLVLPAIHTKDHTYEGDFAIGMFIDLMKRKESI